MFSVILSYCYQYYQIIPKIVPIIIILYIGTIIIKIGMSNYIIIILLSYNKITIVIYYNCINIYIILYTDCTYTMVNKYHDSMFTYSYIATKTNVD